MNVLLTWQDAWDLLTSFIAFCIAILYWVIVGEDASILVIQKWIPNTKNIDI